MNNYNNKTATPLNKFTMNSQNLLFNTNTFSSHMDDIKNYWENLTKKHEIILNDIEESDRMFNMYQNKDFFYKLKEILEFEKSSVREEIMNIEHEILNVKHNHF
jgi:hypothetical protein